MRVPAVGARVVVPLGTRVVTGIVVGKTGDGNAQDFTTQDDNTQDGKTQDGGKQGSRPCAPRTTQTLKHIQRVLDEDAFVPPHVVALAEWTAEYYAAGVGDTIPALLPPMARGGRADAHKTTRVAAITASGLEALQATITDKQRGALELLAGAPT